MELPLEATTPTSQITTLPVATQEFMLTGNSTIIRNLVRSNTNGISVSGSMAKIENNIITNNTFGISGGGTVRNNIIGNNASRHSCFNWF